MAKRCVFFSFHYARDAWRANQVRNAGVVEGNQPVSPNQWEEVKRRGDKAIKAWINAQISTRSCAIVLIGTETAQRQWIQYEIEAAWNAGKGVLGIRVHRLRDQNSAQSPKGPNPFTQFTISDKVDLQNMAEVVTTYDPHMADSRDVHKCIVDNLSDWVEEAIKIRHECGQSHARHIH